jgi:hypothetical protein
MPLLEAFSALCRTTHQPKLAIDTANYHPSDAKPFYLAGCQSSAMQFDKK